MNPMNSPLPQQKPALAVDALLPDGQLLDEEISDEEANAEFDLPDMPAAPPPATPAPAAPGDDTTPSVRQAVNKAADILRQLRNGQ